MSPAQKPHGDGAARPDASDRVDRLGSTGDAHASGRRHVAPYIRLRSLLLRYLSPILVDTVLNQAMFKRRYSEQSVTKRELQELTADMMLGLRMFVHERRLPELMVALADLLELDDP
jgi:hypothetical protein